MEMCSDSPSSVYDPNFSCLCLIITQMTVRVFSLLYSTYLLK